MEREVTDSLRIAASLAAIAAFVGIVFFTVILGGGIRETGGTALAEVKNDISVSFVADLARGEIDNEMPTATAYNILRTYERTILASACGVGGTSHSHDDDRIKNLLTQGSCLHDHLNGRVSLELIPLASGTTYIAMIHEDTCNWYVGNCTCTHKSAHTKLKTQYQNL